MYYVYILKSLASCRCYIGSMNHLLRRFREHSLNQEKATRHRGPWEMVHWEGFKTLLAARRREQYFKTGAGYRWRKERGC